MDIVISILLFIIGAVFGSFYNVVICRVPEGKSIIVPRSSCGSCGSVLKAKDLIPVLSYIMLRGKCRYCKSFISIQYTVVELLSAFLFVTLFIKFCLTIELLFSIYLMSVLLIVFFIDLKHKIIPNGLVIAALAGGAVFFIIRFWYDDVILAGDPWYSPLLGMVVTSSFLLLVALIGMAVYKVDALGMGDVKIFLPIGLFLGLKLGLAALVLSVFLGGFTGLVLLLTKTKTRKSQIPFGPFIVIGTFLSLLFGHDILMWYMDMLI
jgi:leader peptidase (prepilin peptidase)/N-methyltransferase